MNTTKISRRRFLQATGALSLAAITSPLALRAVAAETSPTRLPEEMDPTAFRRALAGPILSMPTTFHADHRVNLDAVDRMVHRGLAYGIPIYALTGGNSKYSILSYDEVKAVTQRMVEAVAGRGVTIAATYHWQTDQTLDYARFSESIGAHALQVMMPKDVKDEDALFKHFRAVTATTRLPIVLHGDYSRQLMTRLATLDTIVAAKEDGRLTYYIDRIIDFGDRLEIFSGGAENRFLVGYPYGARAFFSTYSGFAPDKPMLFWDAIKARDLDKAVAITRRYDYPFIQRFSHPFWHATLEYFGVAERYLRPPFETYSHEQMMEVKAFFDGQGIAPTDYKGS